MKYQSITFFALALMAFGLTGQAKAQDWDWSGDFRFRLESSNELNNTVTPRDRHRDRLRCRFGGTYTFNEEFKIGSRLITGNADVPTSPHEDLGGGDDFLGSFDVSLDRLYMRYTPQWSQGTWLQVGKFNHPFTKNPVYSPTVWDRDVQPEGLVIGRKESNFSWTIGEYVLDEESRGSETLLTVAEISASPISNANLSLAFYDYDNNIDAMYDQVTGSGNLGSEGDPTEPGDGNYVSDYTIVNAIASYQMNELMLAGEYIKNLGANTDNADVEDSGFGVGFSYQLMPGNKVYYQYSDIGNDAVFAGFTQDDLPSDLRSGWAGQIIGLKKKIADNIQLHFWGMAVSNSAYDDGETDYRIRLDFDLKF